jgi:hypothetical protein
MALECRMLKISIIAISVALAFLALRGLASSQPYLICDDPLPGETVDYYTVSGAAWLTEQYPAPMRIDLSGTPIGSHTITAQACNVWGCSGDSAPFTFTKSIPSAPSGQDIVP